MCGKAGRVPVLSEEGAPSAVPTRKHRGGGKEPVGSGKLAFVKTSAHPSVRRPAPPYSSHCEPARR